MPLTAFKIDEVDAGRPSPRLPVVGEALRYLVASVAALALDVAVLWIGAEALALPVWFAGGCAYVAGMVLVYLLSTHWVFAARAIGDRRREFMIFAVLGVLGLLMNSLTLTIATQLGLGLAIAKALSAGVGFIVNFVSRKVLLFSVARR
jgi:putative flippase GtrA